MLVQDERLMTVLQNYVSVIKSIYGNTLKRVILYGSYARGDQTAESDIDIMILVDMNEAEIRNFGRKLSDATFDVNFANDILIMPIVQNASFFERWVGAYPFYNNVNNEGVELYAA